MDKSELEQLINEIYNAYQVDLTSKQDLKMKYKNGFINVHVIHLINQLTYLIA